ncbi:MAG: hypothetical protein H0W62_04170 [Chitinophagales bacterium]|nr:hypothetical protein [Chitinophagales bacterium]
MGTLTIKKIIPLFLLLLTSLISCKKDELPVYKSRIPVSQPFNKSTLIPQTTEKALIKGDPANVQTTTQSGFV